MKKRLNTFRDSKVSTTSGTWDNCKGQPSATSIASPRTSCGSDNIKERPNRKPMPYWCCGCRKYFSVKIGTAMQSSKLSLQVWAIAI